MLEVDMTLVLFASIIAISGAGVGILFGLILGHLFWGGKDD